MQYKDIYLTITNQFIRSLYEGAPPWIRPWKKCGSVYGKPANALSGRKYSGINIPILWSAASSRKFKCDKWLTFKQVSRVGGHVRRGQKGTLAIMYRQVKIPKRDAEGVVLIDEKGDDIISTIKLMRGFTLFNVDQCDSLPKKILTSAYEDTTEEEWASHTIAERLVQSTEATIRFGGNEANYCATSDEITMPQRVNFTSSGGYYSTILHELVHWTGSEKRLARPGITMRINKHSAEYAFEELVAEIGSAYLCADLGVQGEMRHEGYVLSFIRVLEHDPRAIFNASLLASKASSYLLDCLDPQDRQTKDILTFECDTSH